MKRFRIILYILFLSYMAVTMFMGLNVDTMIAKFGLLSFFSFFQDWLIYGLLFFVALMITENFQIWFLKRRVSHAESDRDDLIIRVNDLRRQINDSKTIKKDSSGE
jgi:hypothetical protein